MPKIVWFVRYCFTYLVFGPLVHARLRLGRHQNLRTIFISLLFPMTLFASTALAVAGFRAGESATPMAASILGATAYLWMAIAALVLTVIIGVIVALAAFGALRGLATGAILIARALRVPALLPALTGNPDTIVACQLTDLHLTENDHVPHEIAEEPRLWQGPENWMHGSQIYVRAAAALRKALALNPFAIVVTGDITDSGTAGEWKRAVSLFEKALHAPVVVPGNHDVSFNAADSPDYFLKQRKVRERICSDAVAEIMRLNSSSQRGATFPLLRTFETPATVNLVALDSNRYPSDNLLSNAVGVFGGAQLARLHEILASLQGPLLVLCHHHLGTVGTRKLTFEDLLMNALDSRELLNVLRGYALRGDGNRVLVLHGHRHIESLGAYVDDRVLVYGLSSSSLGQQNAAGNLDGKPRIGVVGLTRENRWAVSSLLVA